MALTTTLTALNSSTATVIATPTTGSLTDTIPVVVQNTDATISIYIGGSTVTKTGATTGIILLAGQSLSMGLVAGDTLYAISASGAPSACVMLGRQ